MKSELSIF